MWKTDPNIWCGDALTVLKEMLAGTASCCITSPPYYALRDYGVEGQIGIEQTPQEYINRLVDVFHEVRRVLTDDGTLWIVIGDTYFGGGKRAWLKKDIQKESYVPDPGNPVTKTSKHVDGLKAKDLIGIPWMLAFALRDDGWYLRQDIIWSKPNPMPESVSDRCTKAHEYIFMFSKSQKYYFDNEAIKEPVTDSTIKRVSQNIEAQKGSYTPSKQNGNMKAVLPRYGGKKYTENPDKFNRTKSGNAYDYRPYRNKRDVWTIATHPCKEAHFATYPEALIEPMILAGCPYNHTVLDPFFGAGTTGMVANRLGRNYIGIELNPEYCDIAVRRIASAEAQMPLEAQPKDQLLTYF